MQNCPSSQCKLCPVSLTLIGVFIAPVLSDKCRNEAPKSALHFGPGRYRLYWNRFHIGTGSRYPTLATIHFSLVDLSVPCKSKFPKQPTCQLFTFLGFMDVGLERVKLS